MDFHATQDCPSGQILLSAKTLKPYVIKNKDTPVTFYFNGEIPCVSYQIGDAVKGDIPINPTEIQKHVFYKGRRYWRYWLPAKKPERKPLSPVILLFGAILIAIAFFFIGRCVTRK